MRRAFRFDELDEVRGDWPWSIVIAVITCFVLGLAVHVATAKADHLSDLRNFRAQGLPANATWGTEGGMGGFFPGSEPNVSIAMVKAGHRFVPSVNLMFYQPTTLDPAKATPLEEANTNNKGLVDLVHKAIDWAYLDQNNLPLCLRTNNLQSVFSTTRFRPVPNPPTDLTQLGASVLAWRKTATGYDTTPIADLFADSSIWAAEGARWGGAGSYQIVDLQRKLKNPAFVMLLENNEAGQDQVRNYTNGTAWLSVDAIAAKSIRMADYVFSHPEISPAQFQPISSRLRAEKYHALYEGFNAVLGDGWRSKLITSAYGHKIKNNIGVPGIISGDEAGSYDGFSPGVYIETGRGDFTNPASVGPLAFVDTWKVQESSNPNAFREISTFLGGGAIDEGRLGSAGQQRDPNPDHLVISPDVWRAISQYWLWSMQSAGKPVLLRHYENSMTKASALVSSRYPWTVQQYMDAECQAVDLICDNPTLRRFWLAGSPVYNTSPTYPRVLECSANTTRVQWFNAIGQTGWDNKPKPVVRVWPLATRVLDETLLVVFSPLALSGIPNVDGRINVDVPGIGLVAVDAPQPIAGYVLSKSSGEEKAAAEAAALAAEQTARELRAKADAIPVGGIQVRRVSF